MLVDWFSFIKRDITQPACKKALRMGRERSMQKGRSRPAARVRRADGVRFPG